MGYNTQYAQCAFLLPRVKTYQTFYYYYFFLSLLSFSCMKTFLLNICGCMSQLALQAVYTQLLTYGQLSVVVT